MEKLPRSEFVAVGGVSTHILKCGEPDSSGHLALVIPGNPGIIEFYEEFMCTLYKSSDGHLPVWGIAHAGHVVSPVVETQTDTNNESMYNLTGQIAHKLLFIKDNIPASTQLILIGHSIGCYMVLEMLKKLQDDRVTRCYLLFPTIEGMAVSPQGRIMTPVLKYLRHIAAALVYVLSWLPESLKKALIEFHFSGDSRIPKCAHSAALNLFNPWMLYNSFYLANIEMAVVKDLDEEAVKKHCDKLTFYFGKMDHWCPIEYYYSLLKVVPHVDARLCTRGMDHAFILGSGAEMAEMVWNWVQPLIDNVKL